MQDRQLQSVSSLLSFLFHFALFLFCLGRGGGGSGEEGGGSTTVLFAVLSSTSFPESIKLLLFYLFILLKTSSISHKGVEAVEPVNESISYVARWLAVSL